MNAFQKMNRLVLVLIFAFGWIGYDQAVAQNINVETPFTSVNDSFYENHGVSFGFSIPGGRGNGSRVVGLGPQGNLLPNVMFQSGVGGVNPPFGGYTPGSGASFGFGGNGYSIGFDLAKGSTRTRTSVAPSLTVQNGFGGSMTNSQTRPFVTGVIPIVGNGSGFSNFAPGIGSDFSSGGGFGQGVYQPDNGVTRAIQSGQLDLSRPATPAPRHRSEGPVNFSNEQSTAQQGALSVSQIKAQRKAKIAARRRLLESTLAEAKTLQAQGELAKARTKYQAATRHTDDRQVKDQIKRLIKATRLGGK